MIVTLGYIALVLALIAAAGQSGLPWLAKKTWKHRGRRLPLALFGLVSFSFAALIYAHMTDDFSVLNVIENSHSLKPAIYKFSGVWGNHEGSMMLWIWVLSLWGFCVARARKIPPHLQVKILAVQGLIAFGFTLFILTTSNPFIRIASAAPEGLDLNPVLQDLGLAIHPPLLYAGYVGFSITFCFAVAALIEKKADAAWAALLRPWVLAAWVALTLGITSGAVWAYYELGWGGFWFWDPVENASLMPWLAGTALLHSVVVLEKRGILANWTIFLAILAFSLSLLGTFLVRSGILTSVHAFASDPARGVFILLLLTVAIGGAFLLFALRAPQVKTGAAFSPVSRETLLLINNIFFFSFCITVMMGTFYPVFMNALGLGSVSVGPPYYMAVLLPLMVPFALLMGAAPSVSWRQGSVQKLSSPALWTLGLLIFIAFLPVPQKALSLVGWAIGGWIMLATGYDFWRKKRARKPRSYLAMALAHAGFGLLIIGITATTLWKEEQILWMKPGDHVEIAGADLAFLGNHTTEGPNYIVSTGVFSLGDGTYMTPEKRWYPVQQKMTSEVAFRIHGAAGLLYLVLGDQDKDNDTKWVVRVYNHPLVLSILLGAVMVAAGGALALTEKRRSHE